jgi:hypothetical protein
VVRVKGGHLGFVRDADEVAKGILEAAGRDGDATA